ncbi:unnamed protein product, partial [Sphacelaria rigidula]
TRPSEALVLRTMQLTTPPHCSADTTEGVTKDLLFNPTPSVPDAVPSFPTLPKNLDMGPMDIKITRVVSKWGEMSSDTRHAFVRTLVAELHLPTMSSSRSKHVETALSEIVLSALQDIVDSPSPRQ